MTRKELIKALADKQGITQITAGQFLDALKDIIKEEVSAGNEVTLGPDFGTFKPTERSGTVPGTTKLYSSKSVKFSVSAPFKRELNK